MEPVQSLAEDGLPGTRSLSGSPGVTVPGDQARRHQIIHTLIFHDAKNRLAALHGYADILRESIPDPSFRKYIEKLDEIARDIERDLEVASIFAHVGLTAPCWQNARDVIGRAASREGEGKVRMEDVPEALWCYADPLLPRVFSNLFGNSLRHGEHVTGIRVRVAERTGALVISVEDDGIGVPAGQKDRIFDHGFGRHTGFGLYLVKEILAISGITIRETGDPGKGACFEILVPQGMFLIQAGEPRDAGPAGAPAV